MSESQVKANPTKATLDAEEHAQDLMNQRKKRADSTIQIDNPANDARKSCSDDGDKSEQDLSDEYPMEDMKTQESGEPAEGVTEEVNKGA